MKTKPTIHETIEFIKRAHAGQVDKAGEPFWLHPYSVMGRLGPGATDEMRLAALLHDVIEDTDTTAADLLELGYPAEVVEAVELLSRPPAAERLAGTPAGATYIEWIKSIKATGNPIAIAVKIADCEDNSDPSRDLPAAAMYLRKRYVKALRILRGEKETT